MQRARIPLAMTMIFATLLAACGGGGGGSAPAAGSTGSTSSTATYANAIPTLTIDGTAVTSTTNTVTLANELTVKSDSQNKGLKWAFAATMSNGQKDTISRYITSLDGLTTPQPNPDVLIPDPTVTGASTFNITAMPGDVVTMTLNDANTGDQVGLFTFDVRSYYAGTWNIVYTVPKFDQGTCAMQITDLGKITGSCSDQVNGSYTLQGQDQGSSGFQITATNGYVFASGPLGVAANTYMQNDIFSNGSQIGTWTANKQ